jgi:phenylpropionate dioxygenase-like ring-hydroxylating dioxygenase large terminal subunit
MLSTVDNDTITRVGRGTPMGEVFRRFWLPVLSSRDVVADGTPVRLRVLGENLVAFRDTSGKVGVLEAACPHRRAKLFWGRNEECGLRCAYHGWKFDVTGQCVDMPSEPPGSTFKDRVSARGYPASDRGGFIWVYMGPRELQPEFPRYEWLDLPEGQRGSGTFLQRSNWLQSLEGDIDTAHVSFLHRWLDPETAPVTPQMVDGYRNWVVADTAPQLTVKETEYGFVYGGRRTIGDGQYYWRLSHWVAPAASAVPGAMYRPVRFLTPIDDEHSISCSAFWHETNELSGPGGGPGGGGASGGGASALTPYTMPDGYIIDVRVSPQGKENDYLIDRQTQKSSTFTGIPGGPGGQDRAMTETMEPILDRSGEHLGTTDVAIIAMRRHLLKLARDLEAGIEPAMARDPEAVRGFRGVDVITSEPDFGTVLRQCNQELVGASPRQLA